MRGELSSIHTGALELQVRAHAQAGDLHAAAAAAERLVRAEPFSEAAHQLRIRVLGEAGDRAGAVTAYEHCRAVLAAELGVRPSAATESVLPRGARARAGRGAAATTDAGGLAAYSVLVVEDHDFQRRTAVQLLRGLGVGTIAEAGDGQAALDAIARSGPPDVIVCDLEMPGMDGVEFIRHVAERELASAVIISSALEPKVVHAVEALGEAYGLQLLGAIEKPLTARQLGELLAAHQRDPAPRTGGEERAAVTAADVTGALHGGRMRRPLPAGGRPGDRQRQRRRDRRRAGTTRPRVGSGRRRSCRCSRPRGWSAASPSTSSTSRARTRASSRARDSTSTSRSRCRRAASATRAWPTGSPRSPASAAPTRDGSCAGSASARSSATRPASRRSTRLRLKGFGVSVEDFGTAHTSAEQLASLPLTAIKLAASVVSGAAGDARRIAALEEALDLARGLGLVVAAAGCDSAADFGLLLQLGCRHAEGAFIADAMAGDELAAWAGRWSPPSVLGESA